MEYNEWRVLYLQDLERLPQNYKEKKEDTMGYQPTRGPKLIEKEKTEKMQRLLEQEIKHLKNVIEKSLDFEKITENTIESPNFEDMLKRGQDRFKQSKQPTFWKKFWKKIWTDAK